MLIGSSECLSLLIKYTGLVGLDQNDCSALSNEDQLNATSEICFWPHTPESEVTREIYTNKYLNLVQQNY